jgi:hypothetical protein
MRALSQSNALDSSEWSADAGIVVVSVRWAIAEDGMLLEALI